MNLRYYYRDGSRSIGRWEFAVTQFCAFVAGMAGAFGTAFASAVHR